MPGETPEVMVRSFLRKYHRLLGIRGTTDDLVCKESSWEKVRFEQQFHGVPIQWGDVTVDMGAGDVVRYVRSDYVPISGLSVLPRVSASEAREFAIRDVVDRLNFMMRTPGKEHKVHGSEKPKLIILRPSRRAPARLAWLVALQVEGCFDILLDAQSGAVVSIDQVLGIAD